MGVFMINDYQQDKGKNSVLRTVTLVVIYFCFLYSFQIPGVNSGTVLPVLILLSIYSIYALIKGVKIYGNRGTKNMLRTYLLWNVFLLVYVFILLQMNGEGRGTTPLKDYIQMLIILPLFFISGNLVFRNLEELMKILYVGVVVQSVIIIAALVIPAISIALFMLIPEGGLNTDQYGGIDMIFQRGYHIGLGVFTSAGSIKMAIGQIGAYYFLINSRRNKILFHLLFFLFTAVATSVVSRTGLLFSLAGLLCIFIAKSKQSSRHAIAFAGMLLTILMAGYVITVTTIKSDFIEENFKRIIDLKERGAKDAYFAGYTGDVGENVIPPISNETLIGLGITYGVSGSGIATYTDGGFMRNYSAMGLIVAIINYLLIVYLFVNKYKYTKGYNNKSLIFFMFLILLFGEFKEYCIYYIWSMCFIFLIWSLIERNEEVSPYVKLNYVDRK